MQLLLAIYSPSVEIETLNKATSLGMYSGSEKTNKQKPQEGQGKPLNSDFYENQYKYIHVLICPTS